MKHPMPPPQEGSYIRITWLPNPRNNPEERSCYIGSEGVVRKVFEDGGFDLTMPTGASLVVTQPHYRYITFISAEALKWHARVSDQRGREAGSFPKERTVSPDERDGERSEAGTPN